MAILVTAAVYIYIELFASAQTGVLSPDSSGNYITIIGRVQGKEYKRNYDGAYAPVIYVAAADDSKGHSYKIQCYLSSPDSALPSIGEYVEIGGKVKSFSAPTNPGEFDSRLYYSTLKISYRLTNAEVLRRTGTADRYREALFKLRIFLEKALDASLKEEDSSIMKAMLLGDKAYMDEEIRDMYKSSGIMHILAVSGLHISLIGMGLYELLKRLIRGIARSIPSGTVFGGYGLIRLENALPAFIAVAFMYSYGVMCGMGSSSFRAICMFALRMAAPVVGRTYDILSALALAGILLLLDQPLFLYNSGFLFSFGAVIGAAVLSPGIEVPYLTKLLIDRGLLNPGEFGGREIRRMRFADDKTTPVQKLTGKIVMGLKSGIAIMIATLPVYSLYYYTYPVHSLLLNLFVIPLMGGLMVLGITVMLTGSAAILVGAAFGAGGVSGRGAASVAGVTSGAGGLGIFTRIAGFPVHLILQFYKALCSSAFLTRKMTWYMGHSEKWQVLVYITLMVVFVFLSNPEKDPVGVISGYFQKGKRTVSKGLTAAIRWGVLLAAVFALTFHVSPQFEINMIDVGQGDGIVISCGGKNVLIDGGSSSKKNVGRYQIVPFLKYKGIAALDAVVLTHEDEDHLSGIRDIFDEMEKGGITVEKLMLPQVDDSSRGENYHELEARAKELKVPILYINTGESFKLGKAEFTCINPDLNMRVEGANEYSTVLFMKYGKFTALFTGDVEGEGLEDITKVIAANSELFKNLTILKVAHHGSRYTTDEEFLKLLNPKVALVSCGRNNSYGHPHRELLQRLEDVGATVYRTDESGEITVLVENGKIRIEKFIDEESLK